MARLKPRPFKAMSFSAACKARLIRQRYGTDKSVPLSETGFFSTLLYGVTVSVRFAACVMPVVAPVPVTGMV
jgi:hypothetical protein